MNYENISKATRTGCSQMLLLPRKCGRIKSRIDILEARLFEKAGLLNRAVVFFSGFLNAKTIGAVLLLTAAFHLSALTETAAAGEKTNFGVLRKQYDGQIHSTLKRFCIDCHSTEKQEGEFDLERFAKFADVRRDTGAWQKVAEMLDNGEMPPEDSKQPSAAERIELRTWVASYLNAEALAHAGDPGPVILRRLNNAEYNYTVRDLTGIDSLEPTREFPVDGAAGEGFTNAGGAQSMSPSLARKYLDAAKAVAEHVVLLPNGIRFSPFTSRRDRTDALLARIQAFYRKFTEDGGGAHVDLQGIKFDTNQGGVLPVEKYLAATLAERDALASGAKTIQTVAGERSLNARYLALLWRALAEHSETDSSFLLGALRDKWRTAGVNDAPALAAEIGRSQKTLWKFNPVGQVGRTGGPKAWMEAVSPLAVRQELRFKLPTAPPDADILIYLTASDLGDGAANDFVVWERPRIEFPAGSQKTPILLRDVRAVAQRVEQSQSAELPRTAEYLEAVADLRLPAASLEELAAARKLNPKLLDRWADLLELGDRTKREIGGLFTEKLTRVQGYEAVNGWGRNATPSLLTNRSQDPISFLTLTAPARAVTVHPSPTLESVVAWRSPLNGKVRVEGLVADADNKCGNGVAWRVEVLSSVGRAELTSGVIENGGRAKFKIEAPTEVRPGDIVFLIVAARDKQHACDTTHIELKLAESSGQKRVWDLAADIVNNIHNGNPLPDRFGNDQTWHFAASGEKPRSLSPIPSGSALAAWRAAVVESKPADETRQLAMAVQNALLATDAAARNDADAQLRRSLTDWTGPLRWATSCAEADFDSHAGFGLNPSLFGRIPGGAISGGAVDAASLCLQTPQVLEIRLPANMAAGAEFVATGILHPKFGKEGSVQLQVLGAKPKALLVAPASPILVTDGSQAERRMASAIEAYRELFPAALCYAKIVPVDEVVTLTLFHREDAHLRRLMLNNQQAAELDRLWNELRFVSQEPLKLVVAFEQISEFATQDRPDLVKAFAPMKKPIDDRADRFRQKLLAAEPGHLNAVLEFAHRAWRRPLADEELQSLRGLYNALRRAELSHEEAIQLTLARVLASPAFLYRRELAPRERTAAPVSDVALASRLSYFLWSSTPDERLRGAAESGRLANDQTLKQQLHRMLKDSRTRRLAIQFACQWLHLREFEQNAEKNEKLYPEFATLRADMYEETVRFFEDMFRNDGSILDMLAADHTFVNQAMARHYAIPGVEGKHWRRVEAVRSRGRGGVLGMASVLASQSGASRTSPILRGNWVYETLLGERLPRPPANVPQLPDEPLQGLTARQLIEQHSSAAACAKCHVKIDPYGFALEQYDAIGRIRPQAVDAKTKLPEGKTINGIDGLRAYLLEDRRDDVVRQFCRKLLGYSLGREVQLSDKPLLDKMMSDLAVNNYRFNVAVEAIVFSDQFRNVRGQQAAGE